MPDGNNPFDLVDDFKDAGFHQKQAEVLARVLLDVESHNVATKQDLEVSTLALKHDIEIVKKDIKQLELKIDNIGKEIKEVEKRIRLHLIIASGSTVFFILTALVTLFKLGLMTPISSAP